MQDTDKLIDLIQSLAKEEKAHFSKIAKIGGGKTKPRYLVLYEKIAKMKAYSDEAVVQLNGIKNTPIAKYLPRYKHELNNKLLESLSIFQSTKAKGDKAIELKQILSYLPFLFEKKQRKELTIQLKKARKIALNHADLKSLIEIIDWEIKLTKLGSEKNVDQKIEKLLEERASYLKQLNHFYELKDIRTRLDMLLKKDVKLSLPKSKEVLTQLKSSPLLAFPLDQLIPESQKDVHYIKSLIYRSEKEHQLALDHALRLIELLEQQDLLDKNVYKKALCNGLIICKPKANQFKMRGILNKLQNLLDKEDKIELDIKDFNTLSFLGIQFYLTKLQLDKAVELIPPIEKRWEELTQNTTTYKQILYCYNIFISYWFFGNLKEANLWLFRLLNNYETNEKTKDLIHAGRILQLAIYHDFKKEKLENQYESTRKMLDQKQGELEKHIKKHFPQLIKAIDKKEQTDIFLSLYNSLYPKFQKDSNLLPQAWEEILYWAYHKISNKSLKELYETEGLEELQAA